LSEKLKGTDTDLSKWRKVVSKYVRIFIKTHYANEKTLLLCPVCEKDIWRVFRVSHEEGAPAAKAVLRCRACNTGYGIGLDEYTKEKIPLVMEQLVVREKIRSKARHG